MCSGFNSPCCRRGEDGPTPFPWRLSIRRGNACAVVDGVFVVVVAVPQQGDPELVSAIYGRGIAYGKKSLQVGDDLAEGF